MTTQPIFQVRKLKCTSTSKTSLLSAPLFLPISEIDDGWAPQPALCSSFPSLTQENLVYISRCSYPPTPNNTSFPWLHCCNNQFPEPHPLYRCFPLHFFPASHFSHLFICLKHSKVFYSIHPWGHSSLPTSPTKAGVPFVCLHNVEYPSFRSTAHQSEGVLYPGQV